MEKEFGLYLSKVIKAINKKFKVAIKYYKDQNTKKELVELLQSQADKLDVYIQDLEHRPELSRIVIDYLNLAMFIDILAMCERDIGTTEGILQAMDKAKEFMGYNDNGMEC